MKSVVDFAPECFESCSSLCQPVESFINQYVSTPNNKKLQVKAQLKEEICEEQHEFSCFFRSANIESCRKVLSAASSFGVDLPLSQVDFNSRCAPSHESAAVASLENSALAAVASTASANVCPGAGTLMKSVVDFAPECFESCSSLCQPVESFINQYVSTPNNKKLQVKAQLKEEICEEQHEFSCFFRSANIESCRKVLSAASSFGVDLPLSQVDFNSRCAPSHESAAVASAAVASTASAEACPGAGSLMKSVVGLSPQCFESCSSLCNPVEGFIQSYLDAPDRSKPMLMAQLKRQICSNRQQYMCLYSRANINSCRPILSAASGFGVNLPLSRSHFNSECGRALEATVEEAAATAAAESSLLGLSVSSVTEPTGNVAATRFEQVQSDSAFRFAPLGSIVALVAALA